MKEISMKAPPEFVELIENLRQGFEQNTGEKYSKAQVMRKMGNKLKGRLVTKGVDFDWKLF